MDPMEKGYINEHYHGSERVVTIDERTGWYFMRYEFGWERHGPYDAISVGYIMKAFEKDTGIEAEIGDRIYLDGELTEITDRAPKIVASGSRAEDAMEQMMRAPGI